MKPQPNPMPQGEPNPPALEGEERARFRTAIAEGLADIAAGRVVDDSELDAIYGPLDDDD